MQTSKKRVCLGFLLAVLTAAPVVTASAQEAMTPDGTLAQNAAIEQSRILSPPGGPGTSGMTADGTMLPTNAGASEDDSFGAQQILKEQQ